MRNMDTACRLATALLACAGAAAPQGTANSYTQVNLASDIQGMAQAVAPLMVNPWGLTRTNGVRQGGGWYISYDDTGIVDQIAANGSVDPYYLVVPPASGQGTGSPAGACLFSMTTIFTTLDGTVQQPPLSGNIGMVVVNNSAGGAVYTACTQWHTSEFGPDTLYVANSAGRVEAYDFTFNPVPLPPGAFTDPNIPAGFTPYGLYTGIVPQGIAAGRIWVAFFNGTPGAGQGYVDAFDHNGNLLLRLQQGPWMDQPYGITQAPTSGFGAFNKAILVGMTGSGMIAAFNPTTGNFSGFLKNSSGQYIVNQGIHGLGFGSGSISGGPTTTLYFTAGIDGFTHGLFGAITAN